MIESDSMTEIDSLDIEDLMPTTKPLYETRRGTQRESTLLKSYDYQESLTEPSFSAESSRGAAFHGDSRNLMDEFEGDADLIVTSPPFALRNKKEYGNENPEDYIDWFLEFAALAFDVLGSEGDLVIDIGGAWEKGEPIRSIYNFELLVEIVSQDGKLNNEYGCNFNLAQDFYWYNPAKLPTPAQWVTIERIRTKDAVDHVWWLSKDTAREREGNKPDNRAVLKPYSNAQKDLMRNGYEDKDRPSGHSISDKFDQPEESGAIRPNFWNSIEHSLEPWGIHDLLDLAGVSQDLRIAAEENDRLEELAELALSEEVVEGVGNLQNHDGEVVSPVLELANTRSRTHYLTACKKTNHDPHPARFPRELPEFFINYLTNPGDIVMDIFAGSNMTGWIAQQYDRNWISFERKESYLESSRYWFMTMEDIENEANTMMADSES